MNSFAASARRRRICLLEFSIVLKVLKLKNNLKKTFQRENATPANESTLRESWECGLISLINSYLAFSFFHFLGQRYCN